MTALAIRRRIKLGPALRITPLPVAGLALSAAMHAALIVALVIGVNTLKRNESQTIILTLVPAVAAIGSPHGERSVPPATAPVTPTPPPPRPQAAARETAPPDLPARDLPPRDLPPRDLPPRTRPRDAMSLPERTLPARPVTRPTPPRPEQKELPAVASARSTTPVAPASRPPASATTPSAVSPSASPSPPAPPQPLGQPTGSPLGSGKLTLDVDFPYAWYLRALVNKINERWDGRALPGNQPLIVFEIDRQGGLNVGRMKVEKSSGNPAYDQIALRSISESTPFPPLPVDFKASSLTIHLQFGYSRGG